MSLNPGDSVAALSVESQQEEEANPNILASAEATASVDGNTNGRANGAKVKTS